MKNALYSMLCVACCIAGVWTSEANAQTISTVAGNNTCAAYCYTFVTAPATASELCMQTGVCADGSGNLFIANYGCGEILKVNSSGIISAFAGIGGPGDIGDGGPATAAALDYPYDIIMDATGNFFISEQLGFIIRKINTSGIISTYAGSGYGAFGGDGGPATAAKFIKPYGLTMDGSGNMYVYDYCRIRKINSAGIISTIAGNGTTGYSGDGFAATAAKLQDGGSVAIDGAGNLYIADSWNNVIRKVNSSGIITTVYGSSTAGYAGDGGPATAALFNLPTCIRFDASGNLFITDQNNDRIRKINTSGIITTVAGNGVHGYTGDGGAATAAELRTPNGIALDAAGDLFISQDSSSVVREVVPNKALGTLPVSKVSQNISLYPNPNTGSFTLRGSLNAVDDQQVSVEVVNMLGQQVYKNRVSAQNGNINAQIQLSTVSNGMYLLHITGDGEHDVLQFSINRQ
jgi:type IX secretion system substrate protein